MKKWFEWLDKRQGGNTPPDSFIWGNVFEETNEIREWLLSARLEKTRKPGFDRKAGINYAWEAYKDTDLNKDDLTEWFTDTRYAKLFELSGTIDVITMPEDIKRQFIDRVKNTFPIDWDTAGVSIYAQNPGDVYPLHYDRVTHDLYGAPAPDSVGRWLIMIYQQHPGQCFFINNQSVSWQAGDIIEWGLHKFSHGGANFGYHTRFVIKITGRIIN